MRHLLLAALLASPLVAMAATGNGLSGEPLENGTVVLAAIAAVWFIARRRNQG
jgi:hypothetical protein